MEPGTHLGPYEIIEPLGSGGMGEVYRARDPSLKRDVAIKVLPEAVAADRERIARLKREAHSLAALNHPNVATIYSLEETDEAVFLVLEVVEGETLAERLRSGALPVEEALELAIQIAEGLEAAHARGIIHRDLKPANVKITPEGRVKVLDFGLARPSDRGGRRVDPSETPTATVAPTGTGVLMGTAGYMSPEQVRQQALDERTDVWAFGCVLYEMLTGRRAFVRETASDTLAAILEHEPDWEELPTRAPYRAGSLLRRCLSKDPHRRWHHIADVRIELEEASGELRAGTGRGGRPAHSVEREPSPATGWRISALAAVIIAAAVVAWSLWRTPAGPTRTTRFAITLPEGQRLAIYPLAGIPQRPLAVSPDGLSLVYAVQEGDGLRLHSRRLDELEATQVPGTEGAFAPFYSPDGQQIGFFTDRGLWRIPVTGGTPTRVAEVGNWPQGAVWSPSGDIYFHHWSTDAQLARVPAGGGAAEPVLFSRSEENRGGAQEITDRDLRWPASLPTSEALLGNTVEGVLAVGLADGDTKLLVRGGSNARYLPSGHLVYGEQGRLRVVGFDPDERAMIGEPTTVVEGIWTDSGLTAFDVAGDETLAYVPGTDRTIGRLAWVTREGVTEPLPGWEADRFTSLDLSPDGRSLAVAIDTAGGESRVWILDLVLGTRSLLTVDGDGAFPRWSPAGEWVAFTSTRGGDTAIYRRRVDGSGGIERIVSGRNAHSHAWTPDGSRLIYGTTPVGEANKLWVIDLEDDSGPTPLVQTRFNETQPTLSPAGDKLAYVSAETGRDEVYVVPYPPDGTKTLVSTDGGFEPIWSPRGDEIFYRGTVARWMVVSVEAGGGFGAPRQLFEGDFLNFPEYNYDVTPDGERFLAIQAAHERSIATRIHVVLDWFDELARQP